MLDTTNYLVAWAAYLIGSAVMLVVLWRLTRSFGHSLGGMLVRILGAAWMLTPVPNPAYDEWLVPALMVLGLGTIADGWEAASHGAAALAVATIIAILLALAAWLWQRAKKVEVQADG